MPPADSYGSLKYPIVENAKLLRPGAVPFDFPSLQSQRIIVCLGVRFTPTGRPATHRQLWDLVCIPASD